MSFIVTTNQKYPTSVFRYLIRGEAQHPDDARGSTYGTVKAINVEFKLSNRGDEEGFAKTRIVAYCQKAEGFHSVQNWNKDGLTFIGFSFMDLEVTGGKKAKTLYLFMDGEMWAEFEQ
jgi:hypothetical protein